MAAFRRSSGALGLCFTLALLAAGCGRQSPAAHPSPPGGEERASPASPPLPANVVERAALPFHGLAVGARERLDGDELLDRLAAYDAVCAAESHPNPHHHYMQLVVLEGMIARAAGSGRELALGLEMFQRPFQAALDEYAAHRIDEAELLERTEYTSRWGFDFSLYRPMVELARREGVRLLALNAPREITRQIARGGLESLEPGQRRELPELDLRVSGHRAFFEAVMRHHPVEGRSLDHLYAAQVVWDETMAEAAAAWLSTKRPERQIVILAGKAHCRRTAISDRIARRLPQQAVPDEVARRRDGAADIDTRVASVQPVVEGGDGDRDGADAPAPFDYLFVMTPPAQAEAPPRP